MYKILVVDDEIIVREGIRDIIPWNENGFELIGAVENGVEAIKIIDTQIPDIVLTDICMPFMDGLELANYISEKYPNIKVLILTGYDNFEYAQQAVKLRAYDFLLKPITAKQLIMILKKIKNELDEELRKKKELKKIKNKLNESFPVLKERFLNKLISGYLDQNNIKQRFKYFNINITGKYLIILIIDIKDDNKIEEYKESAEFELIHLSTLEICESILKKRNSGLVFQNHDEQIIIILENNEKNNLIHEALDISNEIRKNIIENLKVSITIGIGNICELLNEIFMSYKSALAALDYRFLLGKNQIININEINGKYSKRVNADNKKEWAKKVVYYLKSGSLESVYDIIEKMIKYLKESSISKKMCYLYIQNVFAFIINAFDDLEINEIDIFGESFNPFTEIFKYDTLNEIELWLKECCKNLTDYIISKREDFCKTKILKAKELIKNNFQDPNLSLNIICNSIFISISYFSLIFKKYTDMTFVEYLTNFRIEKAKELLKTTALRSSEIAYNVGYNDPHYFSAAFKKNTGFTPTDFRENLIFNNKNL